MTLTAFRHKGLFCAESWDTMPRNFFGAGLLRWEHSRFGRGLPWHDPSGDSTSTPPVVSETKGLVGTMTPKCSRGESSPPFTAALLHIPQGDDPPLGQDRQGGAGGAVLLIRAWLSGRGGPLTILEKRGMGMSGVVFRASLAKPDAPPRWRPRCFPVRRRGGELASRDAPGPLVGGGQSA
jgi:hypothetical protein